MLVGALGVFCGALFLTVAFVVGSLGQDSVYDSPVGAIVWVVGTGAILGALGAFFGSVLGALNGLLLWALSRLWRELVADPHRYANISGLLCAASSTAILSTDWAIHGFDPNGFLLWRPFNPPESGDVLAFGFSVFTTVVIASIMWWTGARVARSYLNDPRRPAVGSARFAADRPRTD